MRTIAALSGFLLLGLSPSFVDWQQAAPKSRVRTEIISYYAIALGLLYLGMLDRHV